MKVPAKELLNIVAHLLHPHLRRPLDLLFPLALDLIVAHYGGDKLMDQCRDNPWSRAIELLEQVITTGCPVVTRLVVLRYLTTLPQSLGNLLVELVPVGNDDHTAVANILFYPPSQPDHQQALARALRVPYDAALAS